MIFEAVVSGESRASVARRFGVHHSTIVNVMRGAAWAHVPRPEVLDKSISLYTPKAKAAIKRRLRAAELKVSCLRRELARHEAKKLFLESRLAEMEAST